MAENVSSKMQGAPVPPESFGKATGLPKSYGETKLVILPRDPFWFYAYWEVKPETINSLKSTLADKYSKSTWVLRVYDITDVNFDGTNAHKYFDLGINYESDNWYVNVKDANRSWLADLGLVTHEGEFVLVARSNIVKMPRHGISPITDQQWAILQLEFEKLLKISGVDQIGKSSFDIAKLMRERWEEILASTLSSPMGASSWKGMPNEAKKGKDFWLRADTELIVYGATEPDAKVTMMGQPVQLYPDGSFSLRFYLPDSDKEYPIKAVSNDGTMERQITFVVKRSTK
jgi:hypothetical protein